jgi:IS605 OrfB family transposase
MVPAMRRAVLRRACKVTLDFATAKKRHEIARLLEAYRGAVNFYIRTLWRDGGKLDGETLNRLPKEHTRLQAFHKDQALKQALTIVSSTKKAAAVTDIAASRPVFKGAAILCHGVDIEFGRGAFDLVVRLSTLRKGERITIPTKRTAVFNKWLAVAGARIVQGCAISENALIVWIEVPEGTLREDGDILGVDVGIAKLLATSEGEILGDDFRNLRDRVRRRRPGSKAKRRARIQRDHFINRIVKQLRWDSLQAIGIEDLIGLKRGKQKGRGKSFRKAAAPWTYRRVRQRIECLAQENRVRLVAVDPRGTSRTCPECGTEDRRNRQGENFRCIHCDHSSDADIVGARNVLARTMAELGSVQSPRRKRTANG